MNPKISVVIPLYNNGPYIARALNSVLAQTFQNFEVIVVDDGSTDGGGEVVCGFDDPKIRLIQQKNLGVSAARNRGIEVARGELIAFLDADDEWLPSFLSKIIDLSDKYFDVGVYATAVGIVELKEVKYHQFHSFPSTCWEGIVPNYFRSLVNGDPLICSSSVAVPKDILLEMNCFKVGARWGEDQDLWGRIALKYPIAFTTSCCAMIHIIGNGEEKQRQRVSITQEHPFIESVDCAISAGQIVGSEVYLNEYLDTLRIRSARYNLIIGNRDKCRHILSKCTSSAFLHQKYYLLLWCVIPELFYTSGGARMFQVSLKTLRKILYIKRKIDDFLR